MEASEGFPAIARADARVLILGSLPGEQSIAAQQYYAHPRNAFWTIMQELFGIRGGYDSRCRQLQDNGIALWDVLRSSVRPGSLDADIRMDTTRVNDFETFFSTHGNIRLIAFNGKKAEQVFTRRVTNNFGDHVRLRGLPSTSPAYAAMSYSSKADAWRAALSQISVVD